MTGLQAGGEAAGTGTGNAMSLGAPPPPEVVCCIVGDMLTCGIEEDFIKWG